MELKLGKKIMKSDLSLLEKADVIVALPDDSNFGTGAEVFYAKQILKKKIVAIVTKPAKSPWIVSHADVILKRIRLKI
jgi:nucleoside 2-deoxyribosyltransferase